MQVIQQRHSVPLVRVEGHVTPSQVIHVNSEPMQVNSYHRYAAHETRPPLDVWAVASDGIVKAVRHTARPTTGVMWHPERSTPFSARDIALFRRVFEAT
jgi:putative glutamine amidotransferase